MGHSPEDSGYMLDKPVNASFHELTEWILVNYGFKVPYLFVNRIKRKYGLIGPVDYDSLESCPPEIEAAIEAALKHFRMI